MKNTKLLLVGWDGADWKVARPMMDKGDLPQLQNIVGNGSSGNLQSFPPFLSPMLWNSIATGKHPHKHGIAGFSEVSPCGSRVRPVGSDSRKCKAIWNMLCESELRCHTFGWFASHPAESIKGVCVSDAFTRLPDSLDVDWPIPEHSVFPAKWADEFQDIRVAPEDIEVTILGFLVPRLAELPEKFKSYMGKLRTRLSELYTIHNAAVETLSQGEAFDFCGVYYHFLDWISHDFMEFHPPRMEHVDQEAYGFFKDVISRGYVLQDLLLRDLLSYAGDGVTVMVISDHGFQSDHLRPVITPNVLAGIAAWHRPQGIFAMAGPGIKRDYGVTGASLIDITPTILHLFKLPVGQDMDGRVLSHIFRERREIEKISTWDEGIVHKPDEVTVDTDALLNQFEKLGYVDGDSIRGASAVGFTKAGNAWNMGVALRSARLEREALPLLEEAYFNRPELPHYANQLTLCQIALGLFKEAEETIQTVLDFGPDHPSANLLMGQIEHERRNFEKAWDYLKAAENVEEGKALLMIRRGNVLLEFGNHVEALSVFEKAISLNDDSPNAYLGAAKALVGLSRVEEGYQKASLAVGLMAELVEGHLLLADICEFQNKRATAIEHCRNALEIVPSNRMLACKLGILLKWNQTGYDKNDLLLFKGLVSQDKAEKLGTVKLLRKESALRRKNWESKRIEDRLSQRPVNYLAEQVKVQPGESGKEFLLVSGLPRSGTSLMMQLLSKLGFELMTDQLRLADDHNPEGYYEWEKIKQLPKGGEIIEEAEGKVTKIISMLLPYLPVEHKYRIIFMERELEEVVNSQTKMIESEGKTAMQQAETQLMRHREKIRALLAKMDNVEIVCVDFNKLVSDEINSEICKVLQFANCYCESNLDLARSVVKPGLYRQRKMLERDSS